PGVCARGRAGVDRSEARTVRCQHDKGRPRDYLTREEVRFTLALESRNPPVGQDRLIDVCATPISSGCGRGGAGSVMNPFNASNRRSFKQTKSELCLPVTVQGKVNESCSKAGNSR